MCMLYDVLEDSKFYKNRAKQFSKGIENTEVVGKASRVSLNEKMNFDQRIAGSGEVCYVANL